MAILRKLPASIAVNTPDAVPKRARPRMGKLAKSLLDELMMAIHAKANAAVLQEKALQLDC
eukprot:8424081-Karenia_brevis.AAC.1